MLNGGHRTYFFPLLVDALVEMSAIETIRDDAEDARDLAQVYAQALSGTSSTSIAVATGSVAITASTGKQWQVGQHLYVARTSAPTTWLAARVVSYNAGTGALSLDVVAVNGSGTYTDWQISIGGAQGPSGTINSLAESTKSAGYTLASGDKGKVIRLDGTFTLAFTSAATLGAGWWCWLHNIGSGAITLDPSSTQQIDGLTSYLSYPGEMRLVWCTGSAFRSVVAHPFQAVYTASSTFTDPPGYARLAVRAWGAGGSGAKLSTGASGGSGGACMDNSWSPTPGTSRIVTIGAGGAAVTGDGEPGNGGGATSLDGVISVPGGVAGIASASAPVGASVMQYAMGGYGGGQLGGAGNQNSIWGGGAGKRTSPDLQGFNSWHGGGGGGAGSTSSGARTAGTSLTGGSGGDGGDATSGTAGSPRGGGGGGTRTGASSGAGGRGELQIWGMC